MFSLPLPCVFSAFPCVFTAFPCVNTALSTALSTTLSTAHLLSFHCPYLVTRPCPLPCPLPFRCPSHCFCCLERSSTTQDVQGGASDGRRGQAGRRGEQNSCSQISLPSTRVFQCLTRCTVRIRRRRRRRRRVRRRGRGRQPSHGWCSRTPALPIIARGPEADKNIHAVAAALHNNRQLARLDSETMNYNLAPS